MGECILQMGSGINTRDIAPQCRNLTLVGGDAKIDVSFSGVAAEWLSLVKFYRVIAKTGAAPASPTDGVYIDLPPAATGNVTMQAALTGLTNDQPYTVRVYVRSPRGWQTAPDAKATATPKGFIYADSLPVGTAINMTIGGVKTIHYIANIGYESYSDLLVLIVKKAGEFNQAPHIVMNYLNSTLINQYDRGGIIPSINVIIEDLGCGYCKRADQILKIFIPSAMEISAPTNMSVSVGNQLQFFKNADMYNLLVSSYSVSATRNAGNIADNFYVRYYFSIGTASLLSSGDTPPSPTTYMFCIPRKTKLAPVPNADGSYNLI